MDTRSLKIAEYHQDTVDVLKSRSTLPDPVLGTQDCPGTFWIIRNLSNPHDRYQHNENMPLTDCQLSETLGQYKNIQGILFITSDSRKMKINSWPPKLI